MAEEEEDDREYDVVVNHEEQFSIWAVGLPMPVGWKVAGVRGSKSVCLAHIKQVWTDMRPLSLRKQMEQGQMEQGQKEHSAK